MSNLSDTRYKTLFYSLTIACILLYVQLAYFTVRQDFVEVLLIYSFVFLGFGFLLSRKDLSFKNLSLLALVFRIVFIAAIPNLSNDFYRFIWDGRMLIEGLNPYLYTPELFLQGDQANLIHEGQRLYEGMGSLNGHHYTCYPPINQLGFFIPALFFSKNILGSTIIMRLFIIAGDIGVWWIGPKLLRQLNLSTKGIFLYLLNPFIIIELTGNLHFEGVMIFFLLWSVYLLLKHKWQWSAVVLALSICVKLIPLIFLPLMLRRLGFRKAFIYCFVTLAVSALLFAPFLSAAFIQNFGASINLYFQSFEFNASVYYVIRAIGFEVTGYNIIERVGEVLPFVTIALILLVAFFRDNKKDKTLVSSMMWIMAIYLLLSTTVHPWYVAVILSLSMMTQFRFALVWSFVVILSYSAYRSAEYHENLWLVGLEYFLVLSYLIYETLGSRLGLKLGPKAN